MHTVSTNKSIKAMTKDKFNWKILLCCGLFIWFIVNLLQGIFTEIQEDEAYYALYGEHLAWGYYDHPPMVGIMTFLSSKLFSGILGVRFFTIIASCLSLFVMWRIATETAFRQAQRPDSTKVPELVEGPKSRHVLLFFTIACSIVMFNIYGFVTTPDASLILFSALFLLVYQNYLKDHSWRNALLMGLTMALMVYSKYHAFLLLGLIVLSNLRLLKDGKFYVACLLALALLTPHILWQFNNDFPSFRYHLSGRSEPFRWSYFLEYLPNQLLIFNPLTFVAVVYVLVKGDKSSIEFSYKDSLRPSAHVIPTEERRSVSMGGRSRNDMYDNSTFERGLRFILIGFFFFFWLMAFRGHVEPHWTIVSMIPAVVLVYRKTLIDGKLRKYIKFFILPSLLLVLAFRILLLTPMADRFGYHGKEKYYKAIEQVAGESPVVFRGSFQKPALYHYFTGKESSSLRSYYDRMTQYDLWQFDTTWVGDKVFVIGEGGSLKQTYSVDKVNLEGFFMEPYQAPNRLVTDFKLCNIDEGTTPVFHPGDTIWMDFSVHNPLNHALLFFQNDYHFNLNVLFLTTNDFSQTYHDRITGIGPKSTVTGRLYAIVGDIPSGRNRLALGIGGPICTFITEENQLEIIIE